MISDSHVIEDHQDDQIEKEKEVPRNVQSTDTEPEAEVENRNNSQRSENNFQNEKGNKNDQAIRQKKRYKSVFARLIDKLPSYKYDIPKKQKYRKCNNLIPLNVRDTGNNRFCSYSEAFSYIAEHCHKNNLKFSRETCRLYLNECYIIDFAHDEFIPITTNLTQKEFNRYFYVTQRELKYI